MTVGSWFFRVQLRMETEESTELKKKSLIGSILRINLANGVCVRADCYSSIQHFLSCRHHLSAWLLFSVKNASKPDDDGRRAQHWLLEKIIATPVLKHYLTTHGDFCILKPQRTHHLAWFFTVIILIQTVKDVTAGVIWHCAPTVDQRFNRYSDLYQSNDLVTGRHAFWKGKTWPHKISTAIY